MTISDPTPGTASHSTPGPTPDPTPGPTPDPTPGPTPDAVSDPAFDSLHGLSVGDALGAQFFVPANRPYLTALQAPPGPWPWTDDTEMACSVYAAFRERGRIDSFDLTHAFARRHDFDRGYGPAANRLLRLIREGGDARELAGGLFDGQGSFGNGAAMRVAPLGAAFAGDPAAVVGPAAETAVITHTHPQAVDGAVAVAVAAAFAVRSREEQIGPAEFLGEVAGLTPDGAVRRAVEEAAVLVTVADTGTAARLLGNGSRVSALDTVPFALLVAARHLDDYPAAIWATVSAGGDVDTTAAIVGGIVAARTGTAGVPAAWSAARESLPGWAFPEAGGVVDAGPGRSEPFCRPRSVTPPDLFWTDGDWQRVRTHRGSGRWRLSTAEGVLSVHEGSTGYRLAAVPVEPVRGGWRPAAGEYEAHPARFGDPERLLADVLREL
ncbi:ADP-ribosylglycohydrolase family protein [Kitasatospora sp. NPDC048365]|uniref:ADP-ribosylglycohydrolase family protein n=1 Tax=Kitasatospora sp. NPDC048365 TaxID=3364050 RepID=UPI00371DBC42